MDITTIQIDKDTKKKLDKLKTHSRETYNDVIKKNILKVKDSELSNSVDVESLIETIEVLSDPECMRDIREGLKNTQEGNYGTSLEDFEKELGLKNV